MFEGICSDTASGTAWFWPTFIINVNHEIFIALNFVKKSFSDYIDINTGVNFCKLDFLMIKTISGWFCMFYFHDLNHRRFHGSE
jgi:hypothetical protein